MTEAIPISIPTDQDHSHVIKISIALNIHEPESFYINMNANYTDAQEALSIIHSGNRVFVQGSAQTPVFLLHELANNAERYNDVELVFMSVYGDLEIDKPKYVDNFRINSLFVSA